MLITAELIAKCEDNLICHCARCVNTGFGRMFYNDSNKNSNDCNHAVINRGADIEAALPIIEAFYATHAVTPRIFFVGSTDERERLRPLLLASGWTVVQYRRKVLLYGGKCEKPRGILDIKRIDKMNDEVFEMFCANDGGGDWCALASRQCLEYGSIDVFVGYENGIGACSVSVEHEPSTGLALVQDVFTLPPYRAKGYAREMMRAALEYQAAHSGQYPIYLWVENPVAENVYRDVGFVDMHDAPITWEAFKPLRFQP